MSYITAISRRVCFAILLFLLAACSPSYHHFGYPGHEVRSVAKTPLRIAVLSFEDKRMTKDEGSTSLALVPLVPTASRTVQKAQPSPDAVGANYYYPGLAAYALAQDLRKNNMGAVVHLNPEVTDQYDLIVSGTLNKLELKARRNTYGLSFLGRFLVVFLFPTGYNSTDFEGMYSISAPGEKPFFSQKFSGGWGTPIWIHKDFERFLDDVHILQTRQHIHGVVYSLQEANEKFLRALAPRLTGDEGRFSPDVRDIVYYSLLDPQYLNLLELADKHQASGDTRKYRRAYREIERRTAWLRKYQKKEWERILKEQKFKDQAVEKRLELLASTRHEKMNILRAEKHARVAAKRAMFKQLSTVLRGSMMAAGTRTEYGVDESLNAREFARDMSSGMARMETSSAPMPPTKSLLQRADQEGARLKGFGSGVIDKLQGKSVRDLRKKFLRLYRRKFTRRF